VPAEALSELFRFHLILAFPVDMVGFHRGVSEGLFAGEHAGEGAHDSSSLL
jgi:hypothetical protein